MLIALTMSLNAQVKVISNGNVGIGLTTSPLEKLHVNGAIRGNQTAGSTQIKTDYGYFNIGPQSTNVVHFISSLSTGSYYFFDKGLISGDGKFLGYSNKNLTLWTCKNYTYTTAMTINYDTRNVGIGRTPHATAKLDVAGDIAINGTIKLTSDMSIKENSKPITNTKDKLIQLQAISFNYKKDVLENEKTNYGDTTDNYSQINPDSFYKQKRYGFSAQDLQKVFPDLVTKDEDGILSVDYIGIIPLLVEAIKEQQVMIDSLISKNLDSKFKNTTGSESSELSINNGENSLFQNSPNPFTESTKIEFYLSEKVSSATIFIYDMNGSQKKSIALTDKGYSSVIIKGNELKAGMYLYALVADGEIIGTKQMILTQ